MEIGSHMSLETVNGIEDINNVEIGSHESIDDILQDNDCIQGINESSYVPKVGMVFESDEDAYEFYNGYAYKMGFGTRKDVVHRKVSTDTIIDRTFCCTRGGFRRKDKRDDKVKRHRAETSCGCKARMRMLMNSNEKLEVTEFEPTHNHDLVFPSMVHMVRSHRKLSKAQVSESDLADRTGIPQKITVEMMGREVGGIEQLGFIGRDCNNYLRSKRMTAMQRGDALALLEYFQTKQAEDTTFFYAIQLDNADMITNIFWTDVRMMGDYNCFGDFVCFDTTYKTNKEGRLFGLFIGVNHYAGTIIFGAALLYDETIPTFFWLFETFTKVMSGQKPRTILIDHDKAMTSAITVVLPDTFHRFCVTCSKMQPNI